MHGDVLPKSWSKYRAEKEKPKPNINEINVILPLMPKPVHTLETQYHCMQITKNIIAFFNLNQNSIDVSDEPVYALTKERFFEGTIICRYWVAFMWSIVFCHSTENWLKEAICMRSLQRIIFQSLVQEL